ncbi:MAG: GumC family protein [Paracoccaceae bacterium]
MNLELRYYFAVFLRRFHWFALVSALVSAIAVTAALLMSPKYQSSATILVDAPDIVLTESNRNNAAGALEQLQVIEERLMTRANLLDVANRLKVFGASTADANPDAIVEAMRGMTTIEKASGKDAATIMRISFTADRAPITAKVVNEYLTLILDENARMREKLAENRLQFFERQVETLGGKLDRQEEKILAFKRENADALPDTLDFRLSQQQSLQERLIVIDRDIASLADQKRRIIDVYNTTGTVTGIEGDMRSPEAVQLDEARRELAETLVTFSTSHPTVKKLQARIAQLEEIVKSQAPIEVAPSPEVSPLDLQIAELDGRVKGLSTQKKQLLAELDLVKDTISRTPANSIALSALERDAENLSIQYNDAQAKLANAQANVTIEVGRMGEKINVIENATVPELPMSPNRMMVALAGILGGILAGLGLVLLLDLLNTSVRRPVDLVKKLGITPIATLPYVRTKGETFRRRVTALAATLGVVLGVPAALFALHTYYLPLDLILEQVMGKVGIKL